MLGVFNFEERAVFCYKVETKYGTGENRTVKSKDKVIEQVRIQTIVRCTFPV